MLLKDGSRLFFAGYLAKQSLDIKSNVKKYICNSLRLQMTDQSRESLK